MAGYPHDLTPRIYMLPSRDVHTLFGSAMFMVLSMYHTVQQYNAPKAKHSQPF